MNFENIKNSIKNTLKKGEKVLLENDIHKTIPKPVAKALFATASFPIQINQEVDKSINQIKEAGHVLVQERIRKLPQKKLTDHEIKHLSETLSLLRRLPKNEQPQKLKDIKETLAWYKIEFGKAEDSVIKDILNNPPKSKSETFDRIYKGLDHLPLSFNDYGKILAISDNLYDRYEHVLKMRKTMNDSQIFAEASGVKPIGDIEIRTTPLGFYIRAHDLEDYTNLYYCHDNEPENREAQKSRMLDANESGGFKNLGVTAENAHGRFFLGKNKSVYDHEIQHQVYDVLKGELGDIWDSGMFDEQARALWEKIHNKENGTGSVDHYLECKKEAKKMLAELFERRLPDVLDAGKDEVLAYTIDGDRSATEIYEVLTDHFGLYNYFKERKYLRDIPYISSYEIPIPEGLANEIKNIQADDWEAGYAKEREYQDSQIKQIEEYFAGLAEDVGYKIFIKKYHKILWDGINALEELKQIGLPKDTVVRILTREPLQKWPKVAGRIKKEKGLRV